MALTKARAAILDAKRRVYDSKRNVLELLDKFVDPVTGEPNSPSTAIEAYTLITTVRKGWRHEKLGKGTGGEERYGLYVAESATATADILKRCAFRIGGQIYETNDRDEPLGEQTKIWYFVMSPAK